MKVAVGDSSRRGQQNQDSGLNFAQISCSNDLSRLNGYEANLRQSLARYNKTGQVPS